METFYISGFWYHLDYEQSAVHENLAIPGLSCPHKHGTLEVPLQKPLSCTPFIFVTRVLSILILKNTTLLIFLKQIKYYSDHMFQHISIFLLLQCKTLNAILRLKNIK